MILSDLSIKRPIFAAVMMLALVTLGIFSYRQLSVEMFPNVEIPVVSIVTRFPGASPETVEREVSKRIEEAVNQIAGVKHIYSYSRESVSTVVVEFRLEEKLGEVTQEARAKISSIRGELPDAVEEPIIQKMDFNAMPVAALAVQSDSLSQRELTTLVDKRIKKRFESVAGVGKVDMVGGAKREISVELDPTRLDSLGLGVNEVVNGLRSENSNSPLGRLTRDVAEYPLRLDGKPTSAGGYRDMVIAQRGGRPIVLGEIATVTDGVEEVRRLALVNGAPAIGLDIYKQSGANQVALVDNVKKVMSKVQAELPPGVTLLLVRDGSIMTRESLTDVKETLIIGGILTILIVFCFINSWRSTVITGITLPISVISAFIVMNALGMTLNVMTLMALSLAIGLLIDDAIVVRENIVRHLEMGKDHMEAARFGTAEIGLAVFATSMSIIAVFIPVAYMRGIVGRFFFQFGITVAFAVLVSLFVSFTLDPMLSSRWHDPSIHNHGRRKGLAKLLERFNDWFDITADKYRRAIGWALDHRKSVVGMAFAAFVGGILIFATLESSFMALYDKGEFQIAFQTAPDAGMVETSDRLNVILATLRDLPEIDHTYATIGAGDGGTVRDGLLYIKLTERKERKRNQFVVQKEVRERLQGVAGITFSIEEVGQIGGAQKPLNVNLKGDDLVVLKELGAKLKEALYQVPGIVDLAVTLEHDIPEYRLHIDRERALTTGVTSGDVVAALSRLVGGEAVTTYEDEDGDAVDVRVRLPALLRQSPAQILDLKLAVSDGLGGSKLVPLRAIASYSVAATPSEINRRDLARQVTVSANLDNLPIGTAVKYVEAAASKIAMPPGYSINLSGEAEDMAESFGYMGESLLLAVIFVYLILAAQFESFFEPFAIMLSLPLAIVGMAGMLKLTGDTINIMSLIGLIMLMGLVTKNAILLVDYAKVLQRRDGKPRREAVIEAGRTRLRPIVMTTLAMIFGMLPLFLAIGSGAEMRAPLARAVVGGLITSTLLTLVVVPVVYTLVDDFASWLKRRWQGGSTPALLLLCCLGGTLLATPEYSTAAEVRMLTIDEVVALAKVQSPTVKRAEAYGEQVAGRYREERAAALPQLNAVGVVARSYDGGIADAQAATAETMAVELSQPLFTWGKIGAAIRAAEVGLRTADDRMRQSQQNALQDALSAYAAVLLARDLEGIARENLRQKELRFDEASRRFAAGVATEYDVLVAQVDVENARPPVIRLENQTRQARERLRFILALTEEVDVAGPLPPPVTPLPTFEAVVASATARRPDLSELRNSLGIASELVTIARTGNRPQLDARGSFGYRGIETSGTRQEGEAWSAGVYLTWPFFDGLRTDGRVQQAQAELSTQKINERELIDEIVLQSRDALNAVQEADDITLALAGTVTQAERLRAMAEKGFALGVKIRLDVSDAELNLIRAQGNLAQAQHDRFVAWIHLLWVMGVLGESL